MQQKRLFSLTAYEKYCDKRNLLACFHNLISFFHGYYLKLVLPQKVSEGQFLYNTQTFNSSHQDQHEKKNNSKQFCNDYILC